MLCEYFKFEQKFGSKSLCHFAQIAQRKVSKKMTFSSTAISNIGRTVSFFMMLLMSAFVGASTMLKEQSGATRAHEQSVAASLPTAAALSLEMAQQLALSNDPMSEGFRFKQEAFEREGKAATYWDNPQLATSIQNLPTDGFRFNQEPMTQVKIGVKQALPRGNVNELNQQKFDAMGVSVSMANKARAAWLKKQVGDDWLNWYLAHERTLLLGKERHLLTQLLDFTESRYGQAFRDAQQQDILQVRLALLSLEDKFTAALQQQEEAKAKLSQWFGAPLAGHLSPASDVSLSSLTFGYETSANALLHELSVREPFTLLQAHPEAMKIKLESEAEDASLKIAREQTKPQWAIEASYGYRDDAPDGMSRADFVSIGVQVDLPFLTQPKQDERIGAAAARLNAKKTDFRLKVNALAAQAETFKHRLSSLSQREALYTNGLIDEVAQLAQSLLTAYTADNGNFTDVINANIQQIRVEEELLRIEVEQAKTRNALAYLYLPSIDALNKQ